MDDALKSWNNATGDLSWGVQHALHDTLTLVADEKVKLTWGADVHNGTPCLINAVANMIAVDVNQVNPGSWFGSVVFAFDTIGSYLHDAGHTPYHVVSPLMADILLRNFGTLKEQPNLAEIEDEAEYVKETTGTYIEPTDADMADAVDKMLNGPNPVVCEAVITASEFAERDDALHNT